MRSTSTALTLLGTQGWIPTARRETTCLALQTRRSLFLFDAGTGLSRLLSEPWRSMVRAVPRVHLFLTHYHLDHTCGLAYLSGVVGEHDLTIHVPAHSLNHIAPAEGVPSLLRPPFHPVAWEHQAEYRLAVLDGDTLVDGVRVYVRPQCHAGISVAYRVEDLFVLATDTVADPATAEFATGAQVLLHEAWIDEQELNDPARRDYARRMLTTHSTARQAAEIARAADVQELMLIHLNPLRDEEYYRQLRRRAAEVFPATIVPDDLHVRSFARRE